MNTIYYYEKEQEVFATLEVVCQKGNGEIVFQSTTYGTLFCLSKDQKSIRRNGRTYPVIPTKGDIQRIVLPTLEDMKHTIADKFSLFNFNLVHEMILMDKSELLARDRVEFYEPYYMECKERLEHRGNLEELKEWIADQISRVILFTHVLDAYELLRLLTAYSMDRRFVESMTVR